LKSVQRFSGKDMLNSKTYSMSRESSRLSENSHQKLPGGSWDGFQEFRDGKSIHWSWFC
jgi:hypothetical protein